MTHEMKDEPMPVSLRPALPEDEAFLYELYCSTRMHDLGAAGFEPQQLAQILKMQFIGQRRQYSMDFPGADHKIILLGDKPIGRTMIERTDNQHLCVDIALLPQHRRAGIGTMLIKGLLDEAEHAGKPFRLHVERLNHAVRLYERLGFKKIGETPIYLFMEWTPAK